jgi:hypothetical protein
MFCTNCGFKVEIGGITPSPSPAPQPTPAIPLRDVLLVRAMPDSGRNHIFYYNINNCYGAITINAVFKSDEIVKIL